MLRELMTRKRTRIVERWIECILESYPEDTSRFLRKEKDPFANPVRNTIVQGIEGVYDEILSEGERPDALNAFLDKVIRIRSVQDFCPSQALAFVFSLKTVIREVLDKEIRENHLYELLSRLDSQVDALALRAFDVYMRCREEIYELRVGEVKRQREAALRMLERSNRNSGGKTEREETFPGDSQ